MILFYRRGGLGDTLLTFPVLEILKKRNNYIIAVGNTEYFKIAKEVNWIDEVYSEFYPTLLNRNFKQKIIFSYTQKGLPPFPFERKWIVDYYLELLNLKEETFSLKLPLMKEPTFNILQDKIVLHPSSGSQKKNPPLELFLKIEKFLKSLGFKTIYLVGEADTWLKNKVENYWESFDPLEIAYQLKKAKAFVGVDSGISHLACYLGIPSYVFFGPTDPLVWKPIGINYKIITLNLPCSPCFPKICSKKICLDSEILFEKFQQEFNKALFPVEIDLTLFI